MTSKRRLKAAITEAFLDPTVERDMTFNSGWWDGVHAADGRGNTCHTIADTLDRGRLSEQLRAIYVRALIAGIYEGDRRQGAEDVARWRALHPECRETVGLTAAGHFRIVRVVTPVEGAREPLVWWIFEPADWPEDRPFGGSYADEEGAFAAAQTFENMQLRDQRGDV